MNDKTAVVHNSRTADKFVVRLPDGLREKIADRARLHHRSMNQQIVSTLVKDLEIEVVEEPLPSETPAVPGFQVHVGLLVNYRNEFGVEFPGVITAMKVEGYNVYVSFTEEIGLIVNHCLIEPKWFPISHIKPFYI